MKLVNKILLSLAPEKITAEQIHYASLMASKYDAEIILLSIIGFADNWEHQTAMVEKEFTEVKKVFASKNIKTESIINESSNIVNVVIDTAEAQNVNLILLGSHKQREGDKHLLGHIAEQIIRKTKIPVMVAKIGSNAVIGSILCPIDFSDFSKTALRNAINLAAQFSAHLDILHVVESARISSFSAGVEVSQENKLRLESAHSDMKAFLSSMDMSQIKYKEHILLGSSVDTIFDFIEKANTDLLCLGSAGRTGLSKFLLGSTTEKIIRTMPVTFLVSKEQGLIPDQTQLESTNLKTHFDTGNNLLKNNHLDDAINQYENCLEINDMHLPSIFKLAYIYKVKNNNAKHQHYMQMAHEYIATSWDERLLQPMMDIFYTP